MTSTSDTHSDATSASVAESAHCGCPDEPRGALSRRTVLGALGAAGAATLLDLTPGHRYAFAAGGAPVGDTLVCLFLRGGMDGLSVVPPIGDSGYAARRPTIAVPPSQAIKLDRMFALHPRMAPLKTVWDRLDLAIIAATGDADGTRSHFDAEDAMERGVKGGDSVYTGWIDRHFTSRSEGQPPFPSVAIGGRLPTSLRGPAQDIVIRSASDFGLNVGEAVEPRTKRALHDLHSGFASPVATQGKETLRAIDLLRARRGKAYTPANGATYPATEFGRALQEVAQLIKAKVGLEAACLDLPGWDMHQGIGTPDQGLMAAQLDDFAGGLAAFYTDLGPLMARTTVVTMSEFGRTVAENGSNGTDHGYGSNMFLMGGGIRGGRVYGRWPTLAKDKLDKQGDLMVTTDYRDVLAEIVRVRMRNGRLGDVFPGHRARPIGFTEQYR
ncbi:MAG TPA: DUF1501 domain-containing protein [Mycobacteriales bacterium]|nr:DUF1501 domain-containing protein [Mycobacteriales bacterium]